MGSQAPGMPIWIEAAIVTASCPDLVQVRGDGVPRGSSPFNRPLGVRLGLTMVRGSQWSGLTVSLLWVGDVIVNSEFPWFWFPFLQVLHYFAVEAFDCGEE